MVLSYNHVGPLIEVREPLCQILSGGQRKESQIESISELAPSKTVCVRVLVSPSHHSSAVASNLKVANLSRSVSAVITIMSRILVTFLNQSSASMAVPFPV